MEFDTKWDSLLQDYNDNYTLYLTKKVKDNTNLDQSLGVYNN